ncbi:hypothetical protein PMAYCL1PPCAC_05065 [Pristionchus mayeri]|uniref:Uncharacterized protein n=1 Tax=Pristionchus mayeri TaxID=1317129 RepID=A0AAN4ZBV5_9BILA|nr:hypothetical protein PMAYCL1PPCAC_05065 [Pristionchus mayeri]
MAGRTRVAPSQKTDLARTVLALRRDLNEKNNALDKLEKKFNQRKLEFASRNCDRKPDDRSCQTSKRALQELESSRDAARADKTSAEEELRLPKQQLEEYDATSQRLHRLIKAAEQRNKEAEATLEDRRQRVIAAAAAEASAEADVQQHAAAKRAADARLAAPAPQAIVDAVEAAQRADDAKDDAAARKNLTEEELEERRRVLHCLDCRFRSTCFSDRCITCCVRYCIYVPTDAEEKERREWETKGEHCRIQ